MTFMNIIVLLYVALFVLICIESFRMHGIYAPIRIAIYSILSLMMANLTMITLSIVVFVTMVYIVIKIIVFLFSSRRRRRYEREEEEETAGSVLGKGLREFRVELYQWEEEGKTRPKSDNKPEQKTKIIKRKRPKIKRTYKSDIPRLHPD